MESNCSHRAKLLGFVLSITVAALLAPPAHAAGPIGADVGWVINNDGSPILTPALCAALTANGVGQLRIGMRSIPLQTNWDAVHLGYYDTVFNNARAAGIQVIILLNYGSFSGGGQSQWNANNHENNASANGDNAYIDSYITNWTIPIVQHFHDRIKVYEILNEPSTWASQSGSVISGFTFMYPSCYSWMLTKSWIAIKKTLGYSDCTVITGGIFGTTTLSPTDPNYINENSGAGWLTRVFQQGNNSTVNSFLSAKATYGVYPVDGYGQHMYIDAATTTTTANVKAYGDKVRGAYTAYDTDGTHGTWMTEFGWTTQGIPSVSTNVQAANLTTILNWMNVAAKGAYVKFGSWFSWQDSSSAGLYFGLEYANGGHKLSYGNFGLEAKYEGCTSVNNGGVNNNIRNYFNAHGQTASLGNPYNNGGGAFVHAWAGGGVTVNVQDYDGGGGTNRVGKGTLVVEDGSYGTYQINDVHGLWDYYLSNANVTVFGAPKNDEYASGSGTRQDFANGSLTWDAVNGIVFNAPITNGTYKIINRNSGLCLACSGSGQTTNGTPLVQWSYVNASDQHWQVTSMGNGSYKIINEKSLRSLDISGSGTADGTKVDIWDYNGSNAQVWSLTSMGSGNYRLVPRCATASDIVVVGDALTSGALIELWSDTGSNGQQWSFQAP